jgi:triacylglycerol esterase/lipase EstA (alpha/beta hydrolase family)
MSITSSIRLWSRRTHCVVHLLLAALAGGALLLAAPPGAGASTFERRPVLFVHGFESAGSNFASQAMRFESNGYPPSWVEEIDYNSTLATSSQSEVDKQIDEAIAALRQRTGKSQVDVIGHSEGTSVMYKYLTEGEKAAMRRASVARYVNIDGQEQNPGVPTLALWAGRCGDATCSKPERNMVGAENVTIPNMTHVQTSTSSQSFQQIYKFFRGGLPAHDLVAQSGKIVLAGKALEFPQNTGLIGDTVQIWPVNSNGTRTTTTPLASVAITDGSTGGGAWGPVAGKAGQRYEFAVLQPGGKTIHVYMEPFVRSDYAIRLLGSIPLEQYTGNRPGSSGAVMIRYKELWGNQPGENDELLINALNVCTPTLCPWEKEVNAFFAYNREGKPESTLSEDPVLSQLPFIQGADVYIPAGTPPNATVAYQLSSRGGGGVRTLNVPNWDSTTDQVEIFWNDFESLNF